MEKRLIRSLPEALLLMAIDEPSGLVRQAAELHYGLAGALLIELGMRGRLARDGRYLVVIDGHATGDVVLDEALAHLRRSHKVRTVRAWLLQLTRIIYDLQERYLAQLIRAGMLRREEIPSLWRFNQHRYPLLSPGRRYALAERLGQIVLAYAPPEPSEIALLRLLEACDLTTVLFSVPELPLVRSRLTTLRPTDPLTQLIVAEVASVRRDSQDFVYIVGIG